MKPPFASTSRFCSGGPLLLKEDPFVSGLKSKYRAERCDYCFNIPDPDTRPVRKCSGCLYVSYCGEVCQKLAWTDDHKMECPLLKHVPHPRCVPDAVRMIMKIILKLKREGGDSVRGYYSETGYRKFRDLMSHEEDIRIDSKRMEHLESIQGCLWTIFQAAKELSLMPDAKELIQIYGKMVINTFNILDGEMNAIGTGLYLGASIVDHSCQPNAVATFSGRTLHIRSIISPGSGDSIKFNNSAAVDWSQIFISYIDVMDERDVRRRELKQNYYFLCTCPKCIKYPTTNDRDMRAVVCPHCAEKFDGMVDDEASCCRCKRKFGILVKRIQEVTEFSRLRLEEMAETAYLDVCKLCLEKQKGVLHPDNLLHVKVLDSAFESSISLEKYDEAAIYGKELINGFRKYNGETSPLLGVLLMKMGKLLLFLGQPKEASDYLREAEKILKISHGEDHNLYQKQLIPLLNEL